MQSPLPSRSRLAAAATAAGVLLLAATGASGTQVHHRLMPAEIDYGDQLGTAVAIDGDRMLIGAVQRDPEPDVHVGAAFLYAGTDAQGAPALADRFLASDGQHYDHFGNAVALAGDAAVAGAMFNSREGLYAGTVHVYEDVDADGDADERILRSPGRIYGGRFGWDVAADGRAVVVGATREEVDGARSGRAYLYVDPDDDAAWSLRAELHPGGARISGDLFGEAVAIDDRTVLVSAPGAADGRGRVHVFHDTYLGGWVESAVLAPTGLSPGDAFGEGVAVHGDTLVVGAPGDDGEGTDAGAAYVYTRTDGDGWSAPVRLALPFDGPGSRMGLSVAVDGPTVAIGAPLSDLHDTDAGTVHVFSSDGAGGWARTSTLVADDATWLGWDVAVSGDMVLAGAPLAAPEGVVGGGAYAFPSPWEDYDALAGSVDGAVEDLTDVVGAVDGWLPSVSLTIQEG